MSQAKMWPVTLPPVLEDFYGKKIIEKKTWLANEDLPTSVPQKAHA